MKNPEQNPEINLAINRLIDQLNRAYNGECWVGQSMIEILEGVTADQANCYTIKGRHNIHEFLLHNIAWMEQGILAIKLTAKGEALPQELPEDQDWPAVKDKTSAGWKKSLQKLNQTHQNLVAEIATLTDNDLNKIINGRNYSLYVILHGIVQHNLYHAGQMSFLKAK